MGNNSFLFNLTKFHSFGRERSQGEGYTYRAQRVNEDEPRMRIIVGDCVEADTPEKLAKKLAKMVFKKNGGSQSNYCWNFNWHSVEDENKRNGSGLQLNEDFSHNDYVRFTISLTPRQDTS